MTDKTHDEFGNRIAQPDEPPFYIYGLHLDGDDEIRYVGSTIQPVKRFWRHTHKYELEKVAERIAWVKANRDNLRMKILEIGEEDRGIAEQRWIVELRSKGHRLLNRRRATRRFVINPDEMESFLDDLPDYQSKHS